MIKHRKCPTYVLFVRPCSRPVTMSPLPLLICLLLALLPRSALPAPTAEPEPTSIVVDLVPLALASGLLLKGEHLAFGIKAIGQD